ncbi:hypothetical protein [Sphingomonas sp. AX6]|uniref:hypothetical protein n=1 Tax=Sphingomonas sp. AX6 TaxID=2653171 RepID=UPI001F3C4C73|nr:hypothetical protein [Sphingomonas sp. AX6]
MAFMAKLGPQNPITRIGIAHNILIHIAISITTLFHNLARSFAALTTAHWRNDDATLLTAIFRASHLPKHAANEQQ